MFARRRAGQDDVGQPAVEFDPLFQAPASVDPLTGREFFGARTFVDQVDTVIELRYDEQHETLRATDRATVAGAQGGVYDIVAVLAPEQSGKLLRVMALRVT